MKLNQFYYLKLCALVLFTGLVFSACKNNSVSSIEDDDEVVEITTQVGNKLMSNNQALNNIIIDDFNGPTGSWSGDFPGLYTYLEDETVLGGARELRSYRNGVTRIDGSAGTLEWGGTNTSTEYALYLGGLIGSHGTPTKGSSPNAGKGVSLNLDIGLEGALILKVLNVSNANDNITVYLNSSTSGWFYQASVTLTEGEVQVPLSSFTSYGSTDPMPAEAATDIDGVRLDGFAHNDNGTAGTGTVFEQIAYSTGTTGTTNNVYISDSSVQTWDPIYPSSADPNWSSTVCYQSNDFGITANWVNPHNAFEVTQDNGQPHPWDNSTFDAAWINSYNDMDSQGPGGHNWSKYETDVTGNGDFVVQLLADNCSWVYLADENGNNPQLIGYQPAVSTPGEYGVTLEGAHKLTFVIFDGGGLAGGKFRLETTESFGGTAPPPIEPENNAPVANAGADQTVTATGQTTSVTLTGTGSSDPDSDALTYSWSLNGNEISTSASFSTDLADGSHTLTLTVSDGELSDTDEVTITVVNTIPVANAGINITTEATGPTTSVTLNGSATDADGDALTYAWSNGDAGSSTTVNLGVGVHTFTLTVTDTEGATDSDEVTVEITDTTAPVIAFNQETNNLWPPNHKMVMVASGISASDLVDGTVNVSVTVSSNESSNGKGDGNTDSDYEIVTNFDGSKDVYLRAERSGKGKGRTYTVSMSTSDTAGNISSTSFEANVDKSKGRTR
ncbi:MAG: PKD domain-containing protein [Balneolaceae bacterium]